MGRIDKIEILLDGNKERYAPGETVAGQVEVQVSDGSMALSSMTIQLFGKAFCIWAQDRIAYWNKQITYDEGRALRVPGGEGGAAGVNANLTQGTHRLPFQFLLTNDLPSTYKDNFGYVKYTLKVRLVKPVYSVIKMKKRITVRQQLDLRQFQNMLAPSGGTSEMTVCCGCCSGPIEGEVHTDRTGYVPRDSILVNATMTNNSSSKAKTSVQIALRVCYITPLKTKYETRTVVFHAGPKCPPGKTVHLNNIKLEVPDIMPSNTSLKIMKFEYAALLQGHLRICTMDSRTFAPIIVGSGPSLISDQPDANNTETTAGGTTQGITNEGFYDWNQSILTNK